MQENTSFKSPIAKFKFKINELDRTELKIDDKDQNLLFLSSLPFSYESSREAIIKGQPTN